MVAITTQQPESGKRRVITGIVIVVALAALVWAFRAWQYGRAHETTDNAQVDGRIIPVLAKVGGYVSRVAVMENDSVRAGDLLVQVDSTEYAQRLAQAEADYTAALANAGSAGEQGQAQAQVASASGARAALQAQVEAARANAARAAADLARGEELAAKEIIPRQQLDALRAADASARANVIAMERQSAAAGASVAGAEAGVRLARARLAAARAARDNAALQLSFTGVHAPERGIVSRKAVEVGQLVQAGQPLMAIVSDSGAWVSANFKETQLGAMRVGQPVEIHVDAYDDCTVTGVVQSISSATGATFALLPPDNATGNFTKVVQRVPVRIEILEDCGPGRPLRPGLSLDVAVRTRP